MSKPYKDMMISENKRIRLFEAATIDESDLEWHRDEADRLVEVIEANGWKFQQTLHKKRSKKQKDRQKATFMKL